MVHLGSNSSEQLMYCLKRICEHCKEHVDNNFNPLPVKSAAEFIPVRDELIALLQQTREIISAGQYAQARADIGRRGKSESKVINSSQAADRTNAGRKRQCKIVVGVPEFITGITGVGEYIAAYAPGKPEIPGVLTWNFPALSHSNRNLNG